MRPGTQPGRSLSLVAVVRERRDQKPTVAHPPEIRPEPTLSFISRPPKSAHFISVNQSKSLRPQTDADHLRHQPARAPLLITLRRCS